MPTLSLPLVDRLRGRSLPTTLHVPERPDGPLPLIVFGHGFTGHPRKFTKLLGAWAEAGYAVAAPAFPLTNDEATEIVFDDVVNQPADVRFVVDELFEAELDLDPGRFGVAGFSLGAVTALAVGFHTGHGDRRIRAVVALAGRFWEAFGSGYRMDATPLLLVHGTADDVVPYATGEAVYAAAKPPKALVTLEGGRHHEEVEDGEGPIPAVVDTTLAFWDLFLRNDESARARLLTDRPGARISSAGL